MRLALFLLALGCAADPARDIPLVDGATPPAAPLPPPEGDLALTVSGGELGGELRFTVANADPFALITVARGTAGPGLFCPGALGGACLDMAMPTIHTRVDTDLGGSGERATPVPLRPDLDGRSVCFQAVQPGAPDTVEVSEVVCTVLGTPPAGDADGDGVPDEDDLCPVGPDPADPDGDGVHEGCPLRVAIATGYGDARLHGDLTDMGMAPVIVPAGDLAAGFDTAAYDVVAIMYNSVVGDIGWVEAENAAGAFGLVLHRADDDLSALDLGSSGYWQDGSFTVDDAGHFVTEPFGAGGLDLTYTYKSVVHDPMPSTRVLGSAPDPSLVVHTAHRRLVTPYYGHDAGMPWSDDGRALTWRSYVWAAGAGAL